MYEDKKQFQHTSCSLMGERRKTNLVRVIGAEIEIHHGRTQESHLAQPHNAGENLPEEESVLGNIVPATLSLLSEQIMNVPTRVKD